MLRPLVAAVIVTGLAAGEAPAQSVREWFAMAPCAAGVSLQAIAPRQVLVDDRNGYVRVSDLEAGELGIETTFAVFRKADGTRIFACHTVEVSHDRTGMHLAFYELRGGRLMEITRPLVPRLTLADFLDPGTPSPTEKLGEATLRYLLPRMGTTIRVEPQAFTSHEAFIDTSTPRGLVPAEEIDRFRRTVENRHYRAIELNWDRTRGVFTAGRKIPR
ncbi:MAG TPA: hypothetical protein VFS20_08470 [Longimicrobium sp.]|nr:hypothetical protein [Longimicrobium sp.]